MAANLRESVKEKRTTGGPQRATFKVKRKVESCRLRCCSFLDQLHEGPEGAFGVHERHRGAAAARPRGLVDEPAALRADLFERGGAVVDPIAHVVDPLA